LNRVRGNEISLIAQNAAASFNPVSRVGWQIAQCIRAHEAVSRKEAANRVIDLLTQVHLPEPEVVARSFPHELSGGMAQRVAIARALANSPKLLIADEPTTALDVTVQAEILGLLAELRQRQGMAILLISHDWGVIASLCDRAMVMYAGEIVEEAKTNTLCEAPLHPYTQALLQADPSLIADGGPLRTIPGSVPEPGRWGAGCRFSSRCSYATNACVSRRIALIRPTSDRTTRCINYQELEPRATA
jgi:peptide/nickel transport system permease protein